MTDYTPTTEDIKYAYAHWKGQEPEFDRWLAEVIREAKWVGWEEGWDARVFAETVTPTENPYRQGEEK